MKRVLIVDDTLVNRKLAVALFARLGWQTHDVDGGRSALDWLAAHRDAAPDLLLLDISMPDLCGEKVCAELRASAEWAALPIVAYTAHAMQVDIDRFLANGFSAVLIKPISQQSLRDVVEAVTGL